MPMFIKLTIATRDVPVMVNVERICFFGLDRDGKTMISFGEEGDESYLYVNESMTEIGWLLPKAMTP